MTRAKFSLAFLLSGLVLFLMASGVNAQTATGRIVGTVQDAVGAAVPNATVTATNEGTQVSYKTTTNTVGAYNFEALQAGSYTILAEVNGFKKYSSSKNVLTANDTLTLRVALETGAISETVQVEGTYERVQTNQSGNIGAVVAGKNLVDLPIVGRNPLSLIAFQPGVATGANTGGGTHIFGARDRAVNLTMDGIDSNEASAGTATTSPTRVNPDSLQEYRVITSNADASFGRNSGGQIAMVTKSGTNQFHGNLYEFHRNRVLDANTWDLNRIGVARRFNLLNQFGGSLGGPIIKNKLFFFFNTQWQRRIQTIEQTNTVYTAQARQGQFRYVVGGRNFPAGSGTSSSVDAQGNPVAGLTIGTYNAVTNDPRRLGLDPTVQGILGLTPLPNRFDVGDGLNTAGYTWLATRTDPERNFTTKIDFTLNDRHSFFGRYAWGQQDTVGDTTNAGAARFPGLPAIVATYRTPKNLAVGWRSTLNSSTTNELIAGGNNFLFNFEVPSRFDQRTTPVITALPTDPLSNAFGNAREITTYQVVDNLTHVRGAHTLRAGLNLRLTRHYDERGSVAGLNINPQYILSGSAVDPTRFQIPTQCSTTITTNCINVNDVTRLNGHINDMLGKIGRVTVGLVSQGNQYAPPGTPFIFDAWYPEYDVYFQDDWRVKSNLTINVGLRYEPKPNPYAKSEARIFAPRQAFVLGSAPATDLQWQNSDLVNSDLNNWAPSVGLAWDPFKNGKTSIRGNFRIAYDRMSTFLPSSFVYPNVPGTSLAIDNRVIGQTDNRLRDGIPTLAAPTGVSPTALTTPVNPGFLSQDLIDPNFVSPKTYMWSFGVQRDVGKGFVVDVQYIGRAARQLQGTYLRNQSEIFSNGFLTAFNDAKAGRESDLLNRLTTAHPNRTATETGAAFVRRFFAATVTNNNVASLAASLNTTIVGGRTLPDRNLGNPYFFTPYPQLLGGLSVTDSGSFSNYHAAIFEVKRQMSTGLTFDVSYVFSKSLDDRSFDPVFTTAGTGASLTAQNTTLDPNNRRLNYGFSDFDRKHVLNGTVVYDLPFGEGKFFLKNANAVVDRIFNGWTVSSNIILQSGRPFTVLSGTNSFNSAVSSRANFSGTNFNPQFQNDPTSGVPFLFTAAERAQFTLPGPGELGNIGRNSFRMPRNFNVDAALIKRVRIRETLNFEFRTEISNLTNTPYFAVPAISVLTPATLGRSLSTSNPASSNARIIQLGAKINF